MRVENIRQSEPSAQFEDRKTVITDGFLSEIQHKP